MNNKVITFHHEQKYTVKELTEACKYLGLSIQHIINSGKNLAKARWIMTDERVTALNYELMEIRHKIQYVEDELTKAIQLKSKEVRRDDQKHPGNTSS